MSSLKMEKLSFPMLEGKEDPKQRPACETSLFMFAALPPADGFSPFLDERDKKTQPTWRL